MEKEKPFESHASANREGARHGPLLIHTGDGKGKAVVICQFPLDVSKRHPLIRTRPPIQRRRGDPVDPSGDGGKLRRVQPVEIAAPCGLEVCPGLSDRRHRNRIRQNDATVSLLRYPEESCQFGVWEPTRLTKNAFMLACVALGLL